MRDSNVAHFTPPLDSNMRIICEKTDRDGRVLRRGWFDTVHKEWYNTKGENISSPVCWYYLPEIPDGI